MNQKSESSQPSLIEKDGLRHEVLTIDADNILAKAEVQPSYPQRRDGWITKTALVVIGGAASVSAVALLVFPFWFANCAPDGSCHPGDTPQWASELIKLALVSSLAFVMGTNRSGSE